VDPAEINIDSDKALEWLESGAEPSDSARSLLSKVGVWQRFKTGEWPVETPRPEPAPVSEPVVEPAPVPEAAVEPAPKRERVVELAPEPIAGPAAELPDDAPRTTEE